MTSLTSRGSADLLKFVSAGGLLGVCAVIGHVANLAEAPRTFLLLFSVAFVCYAVGLVVWVRQDGRLALVAILAVAAACRLVLLPGAPSLSTDAYRYVWDARVARAGLDPYAYAPVAPELEPLRDTAIFPRLNHPTWRTVYPPGAQAFFGLVGAVAPDSVVAMKLALALAEVGALGLVLALLVTSGLPPARVAIYAWNPLVLVEIWGSAHLDALVLLAVTAAALAALRGAREVAAVLLGLGTLVKLYPVVLLPLLLGHRSARALGLFALTVGVGYLPPVMLGWGVAGSLPRYLAEERFNPGLVRSLIDWPPLTVVALAAFVAWAASRRGTVGQRAVILSAGFVILMPNVFPWYAVWIVPFLALAPSWPWIAFTGTVAYAYAFFLREPWAIPAWARLVEALPLAAGLVVWLVAKRPARTFACVAELDR
ncbi:MAG: glycosyltransferase 87 family protein [Candidatus Rokuibacteriota bacterium]